MVDTQPLDKKGDVATSKGWYASPLPCTPSLSLIQPAAGLRSWRPLLLYKSLSSLTNSYVFCVAIFVLCGALRRTPTSQPAAGLLCWVATGLASLSNQRPTYVASLWCRVQDVTLNITASSRIALLGRNGAGKSTLMKLLSGSLSPSAPPAGFIPSPPKTPAKQSAAGGASTSQVRAF